MACPVGSAGRPAVTSVWEGDNPNQAEIRSRPSVAASAATVNMNNKSRVVRIKPKYFGFPPTCACIVVIGAGADLGGRGRGGGRRPLRILARRCAMTRGRPACVFVLAVGKVS